MDFLKNVINLYAVNKRFTLDSKIPPQTESKKIESNILHKE